MTSSSLRWLLLSIFWLSGFAGLIYESIWSHYLKLQLGHAAYAQALVLAIFMGGMALGAWFASRRTARWKNLLLGYAIAEAAIAVLGLLFHRSFTFATAFAFDHLLPHLGSPLAVGLVQWSLATLLILPQCILLGTTFPLMSGAFIRRFPNQPGASLALLYFANSFGAAVGVLVSGFVLIEAVGLPGTILSASLINAAIAIVAWLASRKTDEESVPEALSVRAKPASETHLWYGTLLGIALLTGLSSFVYEIGWIRMLSLVLGSSTHAFELMLAGYILGIALGGLWVRRRIDTSGDSLRFLAWVQIAMGIFALASLPIYHASFDGMQWLLSALNRTNSGYALFNLASHGIALVVMLPATFCAGMTLPLITYGLIKRGYGERSIGATYAANTVGAILGVVLAVHVGMPILGLKGLIAFGSGIDIALGIALLWLLSRHAESKTSTRYAITVGLTALTLTVVFVELDPRKLASGVYRHGEFLPEKTEVLYRSDGKTASVHLYRAEKSNVTLSTNGKPDASINLGEGDPAVDEITMVLLGALPLAHHPSAQSVAVIGIGSGLTTHILLASQSVRRVDTIEIERAMVEAARGYGVRTERTFKDSRSRIHIEDAKSFFSMHNARYDIIVSEPSNPWVSGVAGLFTDEFYKRITRHLNSGGVFVQWLQIYELDLPLVASVVKALSPHFADYAVYATDSLNVVFVARVDHPLSALNFDVLRQPLLADELNRVQLRSDRDVALRLIGDRRTLDPVFAATPIPVNSDYFPVLDFSATRTRFLGLEANELLKHRDSALPIMEMIGSTQPAWRQSEISWTPIYLPSRVVWLAKAMRDQLFQQPVDKQTQVPPTRQRDVELLSAWARSCASPLPSLRWFDSFFEVARLMAGNLAPSETRGVWERIVPDRCRGSLSATERQWLALFKAVSERNADAMTQHAKSLLSTEHASNTDQRQYLLSVAMLGDIAKHRKDEARNLLQTHARTGDNDNFSLRVLYALTDPAADSKRNLALQKASSGRNTGR